MKKLLIMFTILTMSLTAFADRRTSCRLEGDGNLAVLKTATACAVKQGWANEYAITVPITLERPASEGTVVYIEVTLSDGSNFTERVEFKKGSTYEKLSIKVSNGICGSFSILSGSCRM